MMYLFQQHLFFPQRGRDIFVQPRIFQRNRHLRQ
jgi:hypothetical protein